ncbi:MULTISPECIES: type II toxin-antitoxin system HicB family antitoxin [Bacillales]|uniref:type II toxin-antitoxin system HicB family antitoxin n=1 Tax=Bacillales TaxID=1385 RepID=UPI000347F260|nr:MULTISPECIES: type II toxin-antitoxin system HicB family antitoxin [Bacillales]KMZ43999.1 pilus assembly protein HicB [Bacillus sp. FJAT-27238]
MDRYMFAAVLTPGEQKGFVVTFPDLPGCITEGDDWEEACNMAKEALELHLYGMEEEGLPIPKPTSNYIEWGNNKPPGEIVIITAWMDLMRDTMENKAVNTTVTLPRWLKKEAARQNVNLSQVLVTSLKKYLGITYTSNQSNNNNP